MKKEIDRSAREKIIRARTNLLITNGFFGFLAMQLKLVEATETHGLKIDTMAVDGYSLFYNPAFVHSLDERECEAVVAHEVMHCCFQHFSRRGHRNPQGWNIAGDHVINLDLTDSGFKLPVPNCCDAKYKGMNTETVYDLLPKQYTMIGGGGGGGQDPGKCGGVLDAPGGETGKAEAKQTWEMQVRTALAVAKANNAGNVPGSLRALIENLNRPKVSWRELTRRFIDNSMIKETSWSRISRRSASIGTLLPGLISDRLQHLVFFADISGSISHELCREMVSEVGGALDQGTADMVTVAYADTKVQHVDHFYQGDIVKAGLYSGGGTDFRDSFKWLRENAPEASCVIYLTDLQVCEFGEEPPCPVLWAVWSPTHYYDQLAANAPFGQCIHISDMVG